jgi:hypothetical protein
MLYSLFETCSDKKSRNTTNKGEISRIKNKMLIDPTPRNKKEHKEDDVEDEYVSQKSSRISRSILDHSIYDATKYEKYTYNYSYLLISRCMKSSFE